ncbi:MAG: methyltransferase domain-containing protein [Sedimentisphaerales bacterium]|nr:methyltransferase domain-containing protein [Sedimentisphaerales bacterium]
MTDLNYVHGYSPREAVRLADQANTLAELLHHDTSYTPGRKVLEAGCGTGSQTVFLAANSPQADITSMDISPDSLELARQRIDDANITNVKFQQGDIFHLPFADSAFDDIFICFVLEHLPNPLEAVSSLLRILKPGGSLTVIEGDHGSAYFHPDSRLARQTIQCLINLQARMNGNSLIGRELYPLLKKAGLEKVSVSPRMVYVDAGKPQWVEGFTKNTFTAMVEGVREQALASGMMDAQSWDQGIKDLYRTTQPDGTFIYTFFKGTGFKK